MGEDGYNGWKNRETWNVALWIGNDEGLYNMAKGHRNQVHPYSAFVETLTEFYGEEERARQADRCRAEGIYYDPDEYPEREFKTSDGVSWNDSSLDIEALDEMIEEL